MDIKKGSSWSLYPPILIDNQITAPVIAKSMSVARDHINELKVAEAFSRQALVFDQLYGGDSIIQYKRQRVREHILKYIQPGSSMLELNAGTGEDAIFFAEKGFKIHATDVSDGMLEAMRKKIENSSYQDNILMGRCSFTHLDLLKNEKPFDYIFSNFGGLNCTGELDKVLSSLDRLTNPGAVVTLVIISRFCLWETLLLFKGKFKTALRRFFSKNGRKAQVEGRAFKCWYYSPAFIKKQLQNKFEIIALEGLCTIVPPSYIEGFAENYPQMFNWLKRKEDRLKSKWPWMLSGDYFIISFRKKEG